MIYDTKSLLTALILDFAYLGVVRVFPEVHRASNVIIVPAKRIHKMVEINLEIKDSLRGISGCWVSINPQGCRRDHELGNTEVFRKILNVWPFYIFLFSLFFYPLLLTDINIWKPYIVGCVWVKENIIIGGILVGIRGQEVGHLHGIVWGDLCLFRSLLTFSLKSCQ